MNRTSDLEKKHINITFNATYDNWKRIAAYPWLFENHPFKTLFFDVCNDLDKILLLMSNNKGKIVLLRFNYPWQIMLQNQIYTLVKFGGVYNYIVMAGDDKSLKVCFELNLPCFNGTNYYQNYYKDIDPATDAIFTDKKHYKPMNWFKLRFYLEVLTRNYTILAMDADIGFSKKDIWLSLEKYSTDVGNCDMIFMEENPINAGFFYTRPNHETKTLFKAWIDTEHTHGHIDEQWSFGYMRGHYHEFCATKHQCAVVKKRKMIPFNRNFTSEIKMVSVRTFLSPYIVFGSSICPVTKKLDPCLRTSIYIHPICTIGQKLKIETMKENGYWMMQDPCEKTPIYTSIGSNHSEILDIHRCAPIASTNLLSEIEYEKCRNLVAWTSSTG